jgi:hypothetical protein
VRGLISTCALQVVCEGPSNAESVFGGMPTSREDFLPGLTKHPYSAAGALGAQFVNSLPCNTLIASEAINASGQKTTAQSQQNKIWPRSSGSRSSSGVCSPCPQQCHNVVALGSGSNDLPGARKVLADDSAHGRPRRQTQRAGAAHEGHHSGHSSDRTTTDLDPDPATAPGRSDARVTAISSHNGVDTGQPHVMMATNTRQHTLPVLTVAGMSNQACDAPGMSHVAWVGPQSGCGQPVYKMNACQDIAPATAPEIHQALQNAQAQRMAFTASTDTPEEAARFLKQVQEVFHLPISEAATKLGMGVTVLKKQCRKIGIPRWPYRKLASIEKLIHSVEKVPTCFLSAWRQQITCLQSFRGIHGI